MLPEVQQYLEVIANVRGAVVRLIQDAPTAALNWCPLPTHSDHATNSLAVLAAHVAGAEHYWIGEVVGQRPSTRNRDGEFETAVTDNATLLAQLETVAAQTTAVLSELTDERLNGVCHARNREWATRWAILHVIDHTALHLGHMELTWQLWQHEAAGRAASLI